MDDLKQLVQHNYIKYASYVILDRAIPNIVDGLKPVQRRILHTLSTMPIDKLHKVANIAGQTMAFHPHGDAPIIDALVNLANKGYLLRTQGNFGNIYTGDPSAAARYIESSLSSLAKETMFNPDLTEMIPSYDGRNKEPVTLPAKVPLILMQGATGIAVGMATSILPHNFIELLEAEIAILEERNFKVLPDFPTGGIMDVSLYDNGRGKVKLRAKIDVKDPKTLVITEICYGTTTENLIRSIDAAAKRGKIKIDSIYDYTADKVEIEIKMPRGHYAKDLINALYAYTECEVTLSSQIVLIKDNFPCEMTVTEILDYHVKLLKAYLKKEFEIERDRLLEKIFEKTLEQIFIENRLYKKIEAVSKYDKIHDVVELGLKPFHKKLSRIPTYDDRERLLGIPIRKISLFDLEKNRADIVLLKDKLKIVETKLKNIKKHTIIYLRNLVEKYGNQFRRRTRTGSIDELDIKAITTKKVAFGIDLKSGFAGTKVTTGESIDCTNHDRVLIIYDDGNYIVNNLFDKKYLHINDSKAVFVGIADKKTVFNVAYKDPKTQLCFAKRFIVKQFILDKEYRYFEEGMNLAFFTINRDPKVVVQFIPKIKQKMSKKGFSFADVMIKGVSARGIRMSQRAVKKVKF